MNTRMCISWGFLSKFMARALTKKQKGFVKDYAKTGNGVQAALKNYEIESKDKERVAASIATENLTKPDIVKAIHDALPDDLLEKKHLQLLDATALERMSFDENTDDAVIEDVVRRMPGYELLHIVTNLDSHGAITSKYAYVKAPDNLTQDKALDKAYKLKGSYAAEKSVALNLNVEPRNIENSDLEAIRQRFEDELKAKLIS